MPQTAGPATGSPSPTPAPAAAPGASPAANPAPGPAPVLVRPHPLVADVRRIAVLRGGGLGDLVFALPALEALDRAYPDAEIVLLGTAGHAALLADRPGPVDDIVVLPRAQGVHAPPGWEPPPGSGAVLEAGVRAFLGRVGPVDLAVQLHGGGGYSNPFLLRLGARVSVGSRAPGAAELTRTVPFAYYQNETARMLEVAALAGATAASLEARLEVTGRDRALAADALDAAGLAGGGPLLAVHAGATDPRRRWPAVSFGEVAAAAARAGARAAVVGSADEAGLAGEVVATARAGLPPRLRGRVASTAGTAGVDTLVGLLATADVVLGNDSGPRHLAQAVGTPTVSVFWLPNVVNAGPLFRSGHRVHTSWTARCPACGADSTDVTLPRCPHDASFVAAVAVDPVAEDVLSLLPLDRRGPSRGAPAHRRARSLAVSS